MDAHQQKDADDPVFVPFRWRRLYRIPFGIAVVASSAAFSSWLIASGKNEWLSLGLGGLFALYGALIAWEVLLLVIGIIAALFVWDWYQGLTETARIVVGFGAFFTVAFYGQDRVASWKRAEFERRIAYLEQQVYDLKIRSGLH